MLEVVLTLFATWPCIPSCEADGRPPLSKNLPSVKADGQQIAILELGVNKSCPPIIALDYWRRLSQM